MPWVNKSERAEVRTDLRASSYRGNLDGISAKKLKGWIWRVGDLSPVAVNVVVDGEIADRIIASDHRRDLYRAGIGEGKHGFQWAIPERYFDGLTHTFELETVEDRWRLPGVFSERLVFGELTMNGSRGLAGWFIDDGERPGELRFFIDGILVGKSSSAEKIRRESDQEVNAFDFLIPHRWLDSREHEIWAEIVYELKSRILGPIRATLSADGDSVGGQVHGLKRNIIEGCVSRDGGSNGALEVALMVDGVEEVRTRADRAGGFAIPVAMLPVIDWLHSEVEVVCLPERTRLPYAGQHLVGDAIGIEIQETREDYVKGVVYSDFTLSGDFVLEAYDGPVRIGATRIAEASAERRLDFHLPLTLSGVKAEDVRFTLNGAQINRVTYAMAAAPPPFEESCRPRTPSSFVPVDDPVVAARLQELALGNPERRGDSDAPPITGAWRFVAPDQVEGWALDMASPSEPLSVTLYVNGKPLQSCVAREMTQPAEARISFEVPVGFTFFLPILPPTRCELEVRPDGGSSLAPHKPRVVRFDAGGSETALSGEFLTRTREAIDQHVEAQQVVEAYMLARRYAGAGVASIDARHAVLDFALRTEWHTYEDTLTAWRVERRALPLLEFLKSKCPARRRESSSISAKTTPLAELGLPESYASLLEIESFEDATSDILANIEKVLLWRALMAVRLEDPVWAEPERVLLLYMLPSADLDPIFLRYLVEAASQHVGVSLLLDQPQGHEATVRMLTAAGVSIRGSEQGDLKEEAAALGQAAEREFLIVSRAPQIYGVGALRFWPSILATHPVLLTVAEISSPLYLPLVGRAPDSQSAILQKPTAAALMRFFEGEAQSQGKVSGPGALELSAYIIKPKLSSKPPLIVLHDFESQQGLPLLPPGVVAFRIHDREVSMNGRDYGLGAFGDVMKEVQGACDQTPVAFLSCDLEYPHNYLRECLRLLRVHRKEIRLSLCPLAYEDKPISFSFVENRTPSLAFFALLPTLCIFLRDLSSLADESRCLHSIILRSDQPFLALPLLPPNGPLWRVLRKLDQSLTARQRGFIGAALAKRAEITSSLPKSVVRLVALSAQERIAAVTRAVAALSLSAPSTLTIEELERLLSLGRRDLAERVLLKTVEDPEAVRVATRETIETILNGAKLLGLQADVAARLRPYAQAIVGQSPTLLTPLFEFLAITLSEGDYTAALFSCLPLLARWQGTETTYKFLDVCRKYCSPGAFLTLLFFIDSSNQREILSKNRFASLAGDTLLVDDAAPFTLPHTGLDLDFFREAAPLERLVAHAAGIGNRAALATLSDRLLSRGAEGSNALLRALRTYTFELSAMGMTLAEIGHSLLRPAREQLMLASMFNDKPHIAEHLANVRETAVDEAVIAAATCIDDYTRLDQIYERWAEEAGVVAIRFHGDSIWSMFDNFTKAETSARVGEPTEKVSVIMTVYNPDLDLMRSAIISILRQTYANLELLLIDDVSDKVDPAQIEAFVTMDERISFQRMPQNRGPYVGRNRALEVSTGAYVAIQDGDDYSHPQRLERQVAALQASPVLQLCTSAHLRIDRNAHLQFEHTLGLLGDGTMSSMFRRSLFDRLGTFAAVRSRGDVEFRARVRSAYGSHAIAHIDCPLVFCYASPESLSNRIARNSIHFLSLFRGAIETVRRDPILPGREFDHGRPVVVPWPLAV